MTEPRVRASYSHRRGPTIPRPRPNPVGSDEVLGGKVVFADHTNDGQWLVIDDQHVWDLEDLV